MGKQGHFCETVIWDPHNIDYVICCDSVDLKNFTYDFRDSGRVDLKDKSLNNVRTISACHLLLANNILDEFKDNPQDTHYMICNVPYLKRWSMMEDQDWKMVIEVNENFV